jgi:hypothetical protein
LFSFEFIQKKIENDGPIASLYLRNVGGSGM